MKADFYSIWYFRAIETKSDSRDSKRLYIAFNEIDEFTYDKVWYNTLISLFEKKKKENKKGLTV